jgi:hypothetical protein
MYCHNSSPRTMKSISNQNSQKLSIVSTNLSRQKPNTSHPSAHACPFHSQTWQNGRIHVTTLRATGCLRRSPSPQTNQSPPPPPSPVLSVSDFFSKLISLPPLDLGRPSERTEGEACRGGGLSRAARPRWPPGPGPGPAARPRRRGS